jgi:hypothetical protein
MMWVDEWLIAILLIYPVVDTITAESICPLVYVPGVQCVMHYCGIRGKFIRVRFNNSRPTMVRAPSRSLLPLWPVYIARTIRA